jgi:pseudouridine-5'-phosphate glycosidase
VRERGAVPATIAIMNGHVCIGLNDSQLEELARHGQKCTKVSRRDILPVLVSKGIGATTVAATMLLANAAGIRVFVTGGIGGVHRGVEHTMDISADLTELGRTPVAVICAGVKSVRCWACHGAIQCKPHLT